MEGYGLSSARRVTAEPIPHLQFSCYSHTESVESAAVYEAILGVCCNLYSTLPRSIFLSGGWAQLYIDGKLLFLNIYYNYS